MSTTNIPNVFEVVKQQLDGVRKSGKGYVARCPAHDDRSPSLAISLGDDGRVLLHCFAGCSVEDICAAIGLQVTDLFPDKGSTTPRQRQQFTEAVRERALQAAFRAWEVSTYRRLVGFRNAVMGVFRVDGLDADEAILEIMHYMPQIEYYIEILSTGSPQEKLSLWRWGVV